MNEHKNLLENIIPGFIPDIITPDQWMLGGTTGIVGEPLSSGHWFKEGHIPEGEIQKNAQFDSHNCTGFGYTNRIEIIWHRLYGVWKNFSDRWVGIIAGTYPPGNSPHRVAEAVRKNGLIDESDLPFTDDISSVDQFFAPKPPNQDLVKKGEQFLKEHTPNHDWVKSDPESLMYALKFSPLSVAVIAWYRDTEGYYYSPPGMAPTHDTTLIDYESGKYFLCFDSYPDESGSYLKKLRWDFNFPLESKRYWLGPGLLKQISLMTQIVEALKKVIALFIQKKTMEKPILKPIETLDEITVPETIKETPKSRIEEWASYIKVEEGWHPNSRSYYNNNPGNLKFSNLTKELGAIRADRDNFAIFPNYEKGFKALCDFLKLACEDKLKSYHQSRTLYQFTQIYALPPTNHPYSKNIAKKLGVSEWIDIKNLL